MAFLKAILSILMGITCIFHFQQIYLIIQLLFLRIFIGPCKYVHQTDTCEDTFTIYIIWYKQNVTLTRFKIRLTSTLHLWDVTRCCIVLEIETRQKGHFGSVSMNRLFWPYFALTNTRCNCDAPAISSWSNTFNIWINYTSFRSYHWCMNVHVYLYKKEDDGLFLSYFLSLQYLT